MSTEAQEPSFFEIEREKLISDVSENLAKAISSLNTLNRKIEANVTVGSDFNAASVLWKKYERAMAHSADDPLSSNTEQLDIVNSTDMPLGNDDVSFGLVPGAGSTSYLER